MEDIVKGQKLIELLTGSKRYTDDFEFRMSVETARVILMSVTGKSSELIAVCSELIERTTALEMWQLVSTNWNLLGNAYVAVGMYERGLECYWNVIKNEEKHNLVSMASLAYNNIAILYQNFDDYDKTYHYLNRAIEALEKNGEKQPRYHSKMILSLSNLLSVAGKMGRLDDTPKLVEKLSRFDISLADQMTQQAYYSAVMNYNFFIHDFSKAKEFYEKSKSFLGKKNIIHRFVLLANYIELCNQFHLDSSYYLEELLAVENQYSSDRAWANLPIYRELRKYYKSINNHERFVELSEMYLSFLERDTENIRNRQCDALRIVENLIHDKESIDDVLSKNTELQLIATEAIRHKNLLQEAYSQIEMINELGRKLTSSLNLTEVVELIYHIIRAHIPVDIFALLIVEHEKNQLRSVAYYDNDTVLPEFTIKLNQKDSLLAECHNKNCIISTFDPDYIEHFRKQKEKQKGTTMESAIYMPLNVGNRLIGIFSIQDESRDIYTDQHLQFLIELLPYLSIALNNAHHSWELLKEIDSHLKTQAALKEANLKLQKMSSLDGLTQISSRRDFESKILSLFEQSNKQSTPICIIMIDIDNFKLYNDAYGHLQGDNVLKTVAKVFQKNLDSINGLSARFGGEEFIGSCLSSDEQEAFLIAEKIRQDIFDLKIPHKAVPLQQLTVSIGMAIAYEIQSQNKSDFMRLADDCLYEAKNTGKNKVVLRQFNPSL